jgi:hypothetical protein
MFALHRRGFSWLVRWVDEQVFSGIAAYVQSREVIPALGQMRMRVTTGGALRTLMRSIQ